MDTNTYCRINRFGKVFLILGVIGMSCGVETVWAQSRTFSERQRDRKQEVLRGHLQEQAELKASFLIRESQRSFERGLITLTDFATQLDMARQLQLRAEQVQPDPERRVEILEQHAALVSQAAERVERFRQPASRGWAADVWLSRGLAAEASLRVATEQQDTSAISQATSQMRAAAENHFDIRLADFRVGLSELPEVAGAAELVQKSFAKGATQTTRDAMKVYQQQIVEVVQQTDRLASRGAGLGRADRVEWATFEQERTAVLESLSADNPNVSRSFSEADQAAQNLFDTQMEFAKHGTASLADLSRSWIQREALYKNMEEAKQELPEAGQKALNTDFTRLSNFADSVRDLRGRNAADVAVVHCLAIRRSLDTNFPNEEKGVRTVKRVTRPYDE